MYHPLQTMLWVSAVWAAIGFLPITRFMIFYAAGQGQGHLQSLVLGVGCILISAIVFVAGILADLIAINGAIRRSPIRVPFIRKRISNEKKAARKNFENEERDKAANLEL